MIGLELEPLVLFVEEFVDVDHMKQLGQRPLVVLGQQSLVDHMIELELGSLEE
jgi:hypothetical protein